MMYLLDWIRLQEENGEENHAEISCLQNRMKPDCLHHRCCRRSLEASVGSASNTNYGRQARFWAILGLDIIRP
jgi:hypothetical protein